MGAVLAFTHTLVTECCFRCGIQFAMPEGFRDECLKDRSRSFYCPSGHSQHYLGPSEEQKLRKRLESVEHSRDVARDDAQRAREQRDHQERRASSYKGHLTKAKSKLEKTQLRVKHGICPCCRRTFKQLQLHMERQHPNYVADLEEKRQVFTAEGGE